MSDESRKHSRFTVRWRGRVAYDKKVSDVVICDISKGGAGVIYPHALSVGSLLSIEFHVKFRGEMHRIRAKTRVVFNTVLSDNAGAKLGLQFIKMASEEMHTLGNVLHLLEESS